MNKLICKRCGHKWESRTETPQTCPKCKNYNWDKPRKVKKVKKG